MADANLPPLTSLIAKAAKAGLPPTLIATLNAYATWANPKDNYANCYASAEAVGERCGRSKYVIRRDQRDLEYFGLLVLLPTWVKGTPKEYRIAVEVLASLRWTEANQRDYVRRRKAQQHKPRVEQSERMRELREQNDQLKEQLETAWKEAADIRAFLLSKGLTVLGPGENHDASRIRVTEYGPGSATEYGPHPQTVLDHQSPKTDLTSDRSSTVDERGPAVENAGTPEAAPVANSPTNPSRADEELLLMDTPSKRRHNEALALSRQTGVLAGMGDDRSIMRPPVAEEKTAGEAECSPPVSGRFQHLSHIGHQFLAEEGRGVVAWSELRHRLRQSVDKIGPRPDDEPLIERVMRSLQFQRQHWLQHHPPDADRAQEAR